MVLTLQALYPKRVDPVGSLPYRLPTLQAPPAGSQSKDSPPFLPTGFHPTGFHPTGLDPKETPPYGPLLKAPPSLQATSAHTTGKQANSPRLCQYPQES